MILLLELAAVVNVFPDLGLVAAVGRLQLLTTVLVFAGQSSCEVKTRSCRGLTGFQLVLLSPKILQG